MKHVCMQMLMAGLLMALALPFASAQPALTPAAPGEPLEEVRVGEGVILHRAPATQPTALESTAASAPASAPAEPMIPLSAKLNKQKLAPLAPIRPGDEALSGQMAAGGKDKRTHMLLPDRSMVVDRPGWLNRNEAGAWQFEFDQMPTDRLPLAPLEMLPTQLLAGMEQAVEQKAPARVLFRVSGEVTNYRERRFLLVTRALIEEVPETQPSTMPETQATSMPETMPTSQPAATMAAD